MSKRVKQAFDVLKQAMEKDANYAWSWHCNIAVMAQDAGASHAIANDGAARFMKLCFGVDTARESELAKEESNKKEPKRPILLTEALNIWEELHVKNTGEIGFCDLEKALDNVIGVENNIGMYQPKIAPKQSHNQ